MAYPLLTLSIVSHGDTEKIDRLLASLQKCEANLVRFQIILTDNLLDELPDFALTPWGQLTILRNKKPLG